MTRDPEFGPTLVLCVPQVCSHCVSHIFLAFNRRSENGKTHESNKIRLPQVSRHVVDSIFNTSDSEDRPPSLPRPYQEHRDRQTKNGEASGVTRAAETVISSSSVAEKYDEDGAGKSHRSRRSISRGTKESVVFPSDEEEYNELPPKYINSPKGSLGADQRGDEDSVSSLESDAGAQQTGHGLIGIGVPFGPESNHPQAVQELEASRAAALDIAREDYLAKKRMAAERAATQNRASTNISKGKHVPQKEALSRSKHSVSSGKSSMSSRRQQRVSQRAAGSSATLESLEQRLMKKQQSMGSQDSMAAPSASETALGRNVSRTFSSCSESVGASTIDGGSIEDLIRRKTEETDRAQGHNKVQQQPSTQSFEELIRNKEAMHGSAIAASSLGNDTGGNERETERASVPRSAVPPKGIHGSFPSGCRGSRKDPPQCNSASLVSRGSAEVSKSVARRGRTLEAQREIEAQSFHTQSQKTPQNDSSEESQKLAASRHGSLSFNAEDSSDRNTTAVVHEQWGPGFSDDESSSDEDESGIEAQAGVPVAMPGAFAVEGMDARDRSNHRSGNAWDDASHDRHSIDSFAMDSNVLVGDITVSDAPLEAELHEEVIVEGAIVNEEDEETDPKIVRRLKYMQAFVFLFSTAAAVMFVISIVTFGGVSSGSDDGTVRGWSQVGDFLQLASEKPQIMFGQEVALSGSGTRLAVSVPGVDGQDALNIGEVHIYDQIEDDEQNKEWLLSSVIQGPGQSTRSKLSMSLSGTGGDVAIGYPFFQNGYVGIYREIGVALRQMAEIRPDESEQSGWFGFSVGIDKAASVVAIGSPLHSVGDLQFVGSVQVYSITNEIVQVGQDILGRNPNEFIGWSVAVQPIDGKRVAVGGPVDAIDKGVVRVYDYNGIDWIQVGSDIVGEAELSRFGESLSLSNNGKIMAIGARGTAFEPGKVFIFREIDEDWVQDNFVFTGEGPGEALGSDVKLSGDGNFLVVGAPNSNARGDRSGKIQVWSYEAQDQEWKQVGSNIFGNEGEAYGTSVDVSSDGMVVVGGAPSASFDAKIAEVGGVRVYERAPE